MDVLLLALLLFLTACADDGSGEDTVRSAAREVVVVTSGPAFHLATLAAGPDDVELIAEPGSAPAHWRPTDEELQTLVSANQILLMGADFEPWTQRTGLPPSRVATLADGLPEGVLITVESIEHTHGTGPAHSHGGPVPTVWTDPDAWGPLLRSTRDALGRPGGDALPAGTKEQLERYRTALAGLRDAADGKAIIATDHGLEYIARTAGFEVRVALLEPGDEGPTNQRGVLQAEAFSKKKDDAGLLVWIDHPPLEDFARVAKESLGLSSVHFDTGASPTGRLDTLERARTSVERLIEVLGARSE